MTDNAQHNKHEDVHVMTPNQELQINLVSSNKY